MGSLKQKDIVVVSLNPIIGHEQAGVRPAVIVSGDAFHVSGVCLICPLTQKIKNFFGNPVLGLDKENGLNSDSEILVGQIRAVDQQRIVKKIGQISDSQLKEIFKGLDYLLER
jgi:mRNA interferase MazF